MSNPTPVPNTPDGQERLKRGAPVALESRKQLEGRPLETSADRVSVTFPGSERLLEQLPQFDANEAHLLVNIPPQPGLGDIAIYLFINNPNATESTLATDGFVTAISVFASAEHANHVSTFRVPLTEALKATQGSGDIQLTVTLLAVPYPRRDVSQVKLNATGILDLVRSTVGPVQ